MLPAPGEPRPDRTSTNLLRLGRDPGTGRIRHGSALDIGLRAGLFADLALAGGVVSVNGAPRAVDIGPTGDRFADAVRAAVAARPGVAWPRWYRHVHTDRTAMINELLTQQRWTKRPGLLARYDDADQAGAIELGERAASVAAIRREPRDAREVALAILSVLCGTQGGLPRPRAMKDELRPLLDDVGDPDDPEDPVRRTVQHALFSAASTIRRVRRGGGPSKRPLSRTIE